ncbi:hypothetical protein BTJ68_01837 [Hortaea werneckii EXF-2000]|uniref:Vacuolar protein sorting-associated protein 55 n=1 Tax=Hortaea werneckii EXF-2000 TaxID=1157616 RepID=A0A1Z5TQP8_HORWE|nr:hypothetical protein BTJ68_01837 [Hortaea werneckii EXF-2000]
MAGLKTIILLSFILAIGFLLVILSSALFKDYLTLLVVATYVVAPIPNWICGKAQNQDDFMDSGSNGIVELGRFMTGFLVVMGIGKISCAKIMQCTPFGADLGTAALPVVLAHCDQIRVESMVMSIVGGLLIYGTIISFGMFFAEQEEF